MRYALIGPAVFVAILGARAQAPIEAPPPQSGSISGRVRDTSGAPLPGVIVVALPTSGGTISRATTGPDGRYQIGSLTAGTYRLDFDLPGFDLFRRNRIAVAPGTVVSADPTLRISSSCECVDYVPSVPVRPRAGVVLDTSGRPLPHSPLEIVAPDRREVAYADATGRFEVRLPNHPPWPLIVSDSGLSRREIQASRAHVTPMVTRLEPAAIQSVPETEIFSRGCRCNGDLFTHHGR